MTDEELKGWNAALDRLGVIIAGDLTEIEERIERGKGTWPERDYVRDEDWARFLERRSIFAAVMRKISSLRAARPTAPSAPTELSQRVAAALEKSKPLVAEALKLGRSISGPDPTLAGVVIGTPSPTVPATCARCDGRRVIEKAGIFDSGVHEAFEVSCPDCAAGAK